ncbi:hypothetical protein QS257_14055 [Terrilactibacillus sp. S3-3]|nr:hypothetical protein QS257_14055 [Terrilactibacillus sp. S3-3]
MYQAQSARHLEEKEQAGIVKQHQEQTIYDQAPDQQRGKTALVTRRIGHPLFSYYDCFQSSQTICS